MTGKISQQLDDQGLDYPVHNSCYTLVNNRQLHYLQAGKNHPETVVMVHGNPSWSFYYRHLFNVLCKQYHCIAPDHIGMGLSAKPAACEYDFTLKQRVDDLECLLESLGVAQATLIVHDWGGMIGMAYASRHPGKIKRLVFSNTACFRLAEHQSIPWQLKLSRLPFIGALFVQGFNAFCLGATMQCITRKKMTSKIRDAYIAPYNNWANRLAILRFIEDIPLDHNHVSYANIVAVEQNLSQFATLPILFCWGLNDFVFDPSYLAKWKEYFPTAEYHTFDAGHYLLEDAADEVIPIITTFLEKTTEQ